MYFSPILANIRIFILDNGGDRLALRYFYKKSARIPPQISILFKWGEESIFLGFKAAYKKIRLQMDKYLKIAK